MALNDSLRTVEELRTAVTLSASQHPTNVVKVVRTHALESSAQIKSASSCCGFGLKQKNKNSPVFQCSLLQRNFFGNNGKFDSVQQLEEDPNTTSVKLLRTAGVYLRCYFQNKRAV